MSYELQKIQAKHRVILRLAALGRTNRSIAAYCGVTSVTVANIVNSEVGKQVLDDYRNQMDGKMVNLATYDKIKRMLQVEAPEALNILVAIRDADPAYGFATVSDALREKAAESLLSRAGHGEIKTTHSMIETQEKISPTQLKQLMALVEGESLQLAADDDGAYSYIGDMDDPDVLEDDLPFATSA